MNTATYADIEPDPHPGQGDGCEHLVLALAGPAIALWAAGSAIDWINARLAIIGLPQNLIWRILSAMLFGLDSLVHALNPNWPVFWHSGTYAGIALGLIAGAAVFTLLAIRALVRSARTIRTNLRQAKNP